MTDEVSDDRTQGPPERAPFPLTTYVQRLTERVRAFDRRRPLGWDLLLSGFFVTAALIDYTGGGWRNIAHNTDVPGPLLLCLSLALTVPLLWRRTRPMTGLAVMVAAGVVNSWTGALLQAALVQLIVVFNVALHRPLKLLAGAGAMTLLPVVVGVARYPKGSWDQQIVPQVWSITLVALLGIAVRSRQEYTSSLVERARRLEVERDQQAQLAAAAERTRIAREMHDIIGHNLSVITGLADGGSYAAAKDPERAGQALDAIATTSRQALAELRRLLDVLREEAGPTPELAPQPALTDLDQLVDGVRAAGLPVRLALRGHPGSLAPGKELTVYRVVQEALTNTLKHAGPGAVAAVDVTYGDDGVRVSVTDTGRGGQARDLGSGRGLNGMRERTSLYGGTLEARPLPTPPGGWRVRLHLPKEPSP
ncbi:MULTISPECIES: sensor histidine kinase [unclassified Streptomyces]|uniref:sensor histidine kinase n=1 Tax=unclassified Streptomyces TaxID=2593676 RepID=UPI0036E08734